MKQHQDKTAQTMNKGVKARDFQALAIHPGFISRAQNIFGYEPEANAQSTAKNLMHEAVDGIAQIDISGVLGFRLYDWQKAMGGVDALDVISAIQQASEDESVSTIVLNVDSPGGSVGGIPELAETIAGVQESGDKRIIARTDTIAASAAYYAIAGANEIHASKSAEVGSIGVYLVTAEWVDMLSEEGINVEIFRAGKFKAAGHPYMKMSEEIREHLQTEVNETWEGFKAFVSRYRTSLTEDHMQGQTFNGVKAASIGMVDGIIKPMSAP